MTSVIAWLLWTDWKVSSCWDLLLSDVCAKEMMLIVSHHLRSISSNSQRHRNEHFAQVTPDLSVIIVFPLVCVETVGGMKTEQGGYF